MVFPDGAQGGRAAYLKRLFARSPSSWPTLPSVELAGRASLRQRAGEGRPRQLAELAGNIVRGSRLGLEIELKGPVGERNIYTLRGRGVALCDASSEEARSRRSPARSPRATARRSTVPSPTRSSPRCAGVALERAGPASRFDIVLTDRSGEDLVAFSTAIARRDGPIANIYRVDLDAVRRDEAPLDLLLSETSLCVNTTAAGGNASLMSIG